MRLGRVCSIYESDTTQTCVTTSRHKLAWGVAERNVDSGTRISNDGPISIESRCEDVKTSRLYRGWAEKSSVRLALSWQL